MTITLSPEEIDRRNKLVDEHVKAEVDQDLDAIMRTWGKNPWFDDVAWEEQSYGRDEIRVHYEELLTSFPDLGIEVLARHITDDAMILEVLVTGTHLGPWRDLPPLGRRMESRICALYTFDDEGLLELERTYYDKALLLQQLGMYADPRTTTGKVLAVITPPFSIARSLLRRALRRS